MKILELVIKRVDVPGLVVDVLDLVLEPALDRLVKSTKTPFDDVAKAALYNPLREVIVDMAQDKWAELAKKIASPSA